MFFAALDDSTPSNPHTETYTDSDDANDRYTATFIDDNEINYHILASNDEDNLNMSSSFMTIDISDTERAQVQGRQ